MDRNGKIKLITDTQYWLLFTLYCSASHIFLKMRELENKIVSILGLSVDDPHPLLDALYCEEEPSKKKFDDLLTSSRISVDARVAESPDELK